MTTEWTAKTPETQKVKEAIINWNGPFSVQDIAKKAGVKQVKAGQHILYIHKIGIIDRISYNNYIKKNLPSQQKTPQILRENTFNTLEVGESIITLVESLKKKIQELEDENKTLTDISEDYDRLAQDNRVLQERVTELSTRASASNLKQLKL